MSELQINVQGTPNPNAAKFQLDGTRLGDSSRFYVASSEAANDPLAARLFEIAGVRALLIVEDFITVTKHEDADWNDLVVRVEEVIRAELDAG